MNFYNWVFFKAGKKERKKKISRFSRDDGISLLETCPASYVSFSPVDYPELFPATSPSVVRGEGGREVCVRVLCESVCVSPCTCGGRYRRPSPDH